VVGVVDENFELFLGGISLARLGSARVGLPARLVKSLSRQSFKATKATKATKVRFGRLCRTRKLIRNGSPAE
jgi:hypothetical protein